MKKIMWKCLKCKSLFSDIEKEKEDDNRCPKCGVAFSQMPYEAPHEISDYEIVKDMKKTKNTNPKFYENWSREQLIKELCRLNQLLVDMLKIIKKP